MKTTIYPKDTIMRGSTLAGFDRIELSKEILLEDGPFGLSELLNEERMLEFLRENPTAAAELLSYDSPTIYYMGGYADRMVNGKTLGVKLLGDGLTVDGDNAFGEFLARVREDFRTEIRSRALQEEPLNPKRFIFEFTPSGETESNIDVLAADGEKFIFTEPGYRSMYKDVALDGTTGHRQKDYDPDVPFHTFVNPFGTTGYAKVRVGSQAEASLYYEKGLRGELDFEKLLQTLRNNGLNIKMDKAQVEGLCTDLKAQFAWMREEICRDNTKYRSMRIVTGSGLINDYSFGRSIYDPDFAPSPAHILGRYINNPELLFSNSENGVVRALESTNKNELDRIGVTNPQSRISILVDGSDTIGGRVPGTKATTEKRDVYARDEDGNIVYDARGKAVVASRETVHKYMFKDRETIDAEYARFKERLESVISNVSPDTKIEFVTGTGIGVPQMVRRFVDEMKGTVSDWDYTARTRRAAHEGEGGSRFSALRIENLNDVIPVVAGVQGKQVLSVDDNGNPDKVFVIGDVPVQAGIYFSDNEDTRNLRSTQRGSLVQFSGIPMVHVLDNRSESDQSAALLLGAAATRSIVAGEARFEKSLFGPELRKEWGSDDKETLGFVVEKTAVPFVSFLQKTPVYVDNTPFRSVFGAFTALLAKEAGVVNHGYFRDLASKEESFASVNTLFNELMENSRDRIDDTLVEKCMRNSVRMFSEVSSAFSARLLASGESPIVEHATEGKVLFTDIKGNGENRFGIVLMNEREEIRRQMEASRKNAELQAQRSLEDSIRLNKTVNKKRARGELSEAGLPQSVEKAAGKVWFLGTHRPVGLSLPEDKPSFSTWVEMPGGVDAPTREIIGRKKIMDETDGLVDNNMIFLFPSDYEACSGRRHVNNSPDSKDLTGLKRYNPETKREFTCAFGIPVKNDNRHFEFDNPYWMPCSFYMDKDFSRLMSSLVLTDAVARRTAIEEGMSLALNIYSRDNADGTWDDDLSRVFKAKVWDYPREKGVVDRRTGKTIGNDGAIIPSEVKKRVYNSSTGKYEYDVTLQNKKTWIDNPHGSEKNMQLIRNYEQILVQGSTMPLNCICLPCSEYGEGDEMKFMMDLNLALNIANTTASQMGVPMSFPLDKDGNIDLGPDIPEKLRKMAQRKIESFIGVSDRNDISNAELPVINRIPVHEAFRKNVTLMRDGSDIYIRPNDLLTAFGQFKFDFSGVADSGGKTKFISPIHEMAFVDSEGIIFKLTGTRSTANISLGELNKYMRYERNDEYRFTVSSSNPDRIPDFLASLRLYMDRAKTIGVETRLLTMEEASGMDMDMGGCIRLHSSNDSAVGDNIGLYETVGGKKVQTKEYELGARDTSSVESPSRFDGTDNEMEYAGKEDAKDAFVGYAQFRYTMSDGRTSEWKTVTDLDLAKDIIYSSVNRKYRSDVYVVPEKRVIDACLRAEAVKDAGASFLSAAKDSRSQTPVRTKADVTVKAAAVESSPAPKKMNIYAGAKENVELSNLASRPFKYNVRKFNVKM